MDGEPVRSRHLPQSLGCGKNFYGPAKLTTTKQVESVAVTASSVYIHVHVTLCVCMCVCCVGERERRDIHVDREGECRVGRALVSFASAATACLQGLT